jgi:CAAX prenyl protease-like protein
VVGLRHHGYARAVEDRNQERPHGEPDEPGPSAPPPGPGEAPDATFVEDAAGPVAAPVPAAPIPRLPGDPDLPWDPSARSRHPGLLEWTLILGIGGGALVLLGQAEASVLVALAGLFIAAQGADLDLAWRRVYHLTSWTVPVAGMAAFALLAHQFWSHSGLSPGVRWFATTFSGASAVLCILTGLRPVSNGLILLFFHAHVPNHTLRLAARLVVMTLMIGVAGWFSYQFLLPLVATDLRDAIVPERLGSALIGYVALAFASVGFLVRRGLGATLERLGIRPFTRRDALVVPLAVVALWMLNAATEGAERRFAPALWQQDQSFTTLLASDMTPVQAALVGLSAGIGEEITMRGALQPRLGIPLTALLFAVLHVQYSWFGLGVIFAIGVLLGVLRRVTSTTVTMTVHVLYDAVALLAAMRAGGAT